MNIAIIAQGSQGDVQPYVALGAGLRTAGHSVRLVGPENYEPLVRAHGLEFWPLRGDVRAALESPEMQALAERGNFLEITRHTARLAEGAAVRWAQDGLAACRGVDLLVTGVGGLFIGLGIAETLDLPVAQAHVFPFTPTAAFPGVLVPQGVARLGGAANRLSHELLRQLMWQGFRRADVLARRTVLGLPPAPALGPYRSARLRRFDVLYGFSPAVIPPPPDWKDARITGYWFLDADPSWTPSPDLAAFLEAGPPPVYVGFGSMGIRDPERTADLVLRAVLRSGQRAVLQSGWGGLRPQSVPRTVHLVDSVPHAWLFPRMAAVVHHGGAGTTAAGLRAGVPSVVVPFFGDQTFWGGRVAALGAGPTPIPRRRLTEDGLAHTIRAAAGAGVRERAAALGRTIRAEDGVGNAVAALNDGLARGAIGGARARA